MANLFKQTLELDNVRQEKDIFYSKTGKSPKYIVMSDDTLTELRKSVVIFGSNIYGKQTMSCLFGIAIATCNTLAIGEFEVVG